MAEVARSNCVKLAGGVAVVKVGAATETGMKKKKKKKKKKQKRRVEDALGLSADLRRLVTIAPWAYREPGGWPRSSRPRRRW
jgi:hypothetical protein